MATTALVPAFSRVGVRVQAREQDLAPGAVITYYYREAGGARGSATSMASIPAGATVQRKVTV